MTLPAAYFDGDGDSNRLDQPSDHHDKHASWQTDASGNVVGLVGPDGGSGLANLQILQRQRSPGTAMIDWSTCSISSVTAGWSVTVDPTVTYCGLPTLKITGSNTTTLNATITFPSAIYIGGGKRQHFAVKVGDRAMAGDVSYPPQLRFDYGSGVRHMICAFANASAWDGRDWSVGTAYWGELAGSGHVPPGAPDVWASDVATEETSSLLLVMAAAVNVTEPIWISPFFTDQQTVPTLTIFADGQYSGQWKYLRQALQRANVMASLAVDVARVGDSGRMSLTQISKLYGMGHEAIRHTGGGAALGWDSTVKYPDGSEYALVKADCEAFRTWAIANRLTRGIGYGVMAFTNGMVKTQTLARRKNIAQAVYDSGERKIRVLTTSVAAFDSHFEHYDYDPLFITPSYQLTSASTTGNIDTLFSKLKERGGWSGITFHDIVLSGASGNSVTVATMNYIMDKIAAEVLAGELIVLPFSEAMRVLPLPAIQSI